MSTPEEEDMRKLIDSLDLPAADGETANVCLLSDMELTNRFQRATRALLKNGEALEPKTQTGRDLHSERSAYLIEMRRRRMR